MDIEIRLFGPLEIVAPAGRLTSVDFPSRKSKQVLQVLALAEGRVVSKDRLIDTLWRRRMPRNPSATVELAVSLLRSTLATVTELAVILTAPGGYRLDVDLADVDTARFDQLLQLAAESPVAERTPMLVEALRLADRPLFEDELGAEWVAVDRERYRSRAETAALDLGRIALAHDDTALAVSMAERVWRSSDVVAEEAYALGVAALAQMGRRPQARALLAELEARLEHEEARPLSPSSAALRGLIDPNLIVDSDHRVEAPVDFASVEVPLAFLGRTKAMQAARLAIDGVLGGGAAGLVLVDGARGVGVSRFLEELAADAAQRPGVQVFALRGREADRPHPMLAVSHLLRALMKASKSRRTLVLDESVAATFARAADLLDALGPTVVVVDDAHLLDPASASVLQSLLAPRAVAGLVVVVGAHESPDQLVEHGWPPAAVAARVSLGLLSDADLAPIGVDAAGRLTGGHPATLVACAAAARRDGVFRPDEIAEIVRRADDLGDLGRGVLAVVAHAGRPVKAAEVAHSLHIGAVSAADLLRRAGKLGLLRGTVRDGHELSSDVLAQVLRARQAVAAPGTPPSSTA